jgi:PAS domain S-box-containing protein
MGSPADSTTSRFALREQAMDEAPVGMVITDPGRPDNPITYANEGFVRLTGYSREEIVGRNCRLLQGERTAAESVERMRTAIDAGESVTVELLNYRKNGDRFWNRVTIAPLFDGETVTNFVGIQQDVTDRMRRKRDLEREREFVEQGLDVLDDVFYVVGTDGRLRRWNERLREVTGYTATRSKRWTPSSSSRLTSEGGSRTRSIGSWTVSPKPSSRRCSPNAASESPTNSPARG